MYRILFLFLCFVQTGFAQIDTSWVRTLDAGFWEEAKSIVADDSNNIYVAGWSYEWGSNYDIIIAKYNPEGNLKWSKTINYTSGDQATHILFDPAGFIYVAGMVNGDYSHTGGSFCLMKYTLEGDSVWHFVDTYTYSGQVKAAHLDGDGNIVLAGFEETSFSGTSADFVTMKIDPDGNQLWIKTFNNFGPGQSNRIWDMGIDKENNVFVTGSCDDTVNFYLDIVTIKYSPAGDSVWKRQLNGPGNYFDSARKILTDSNGNIYVAGVIMYDSPAQSDIILIKYDPNGETIWSETYNYQPAPQSFDDVTDLAISESGELYLCGISSYSNAQASNRLLVMKYNAQGDTLWTYRWGADGDKQPRKMVLDELQNVYITGYYYDNTGSGYNGITLKFNKDGQKLWEIPFNDNTNKEEELYSLLLDRNNDIVAAGRKHAPSTFDMVLVKYSDKANYIPGNLVGTDSPLVYPNPLSDPGSINFHLTQHGKTVLHIFDLAGRLVYAEDWGFLKAGEQTRSFEGSVLMPGTYFLQIRSNGQSQSTCFTVSR
jgi:uncharacterized delta-60 repeat protein